MKLPGDAVHKPLDFFDLEDSFGGVPAPNVRKVRPGLNNKRAREQAERMERKKNWVFNTPEEAYGLPAEEEMVDLPEFDPKGRDKTPKSSLERYFERTEKARVEAATNHVKGDIAADQRRAEDAEEQDNARIEDKSEGTSIFGLGRVSANRPASVSETATPFSDAPSSAEKNFKNWFNSVSGDSSPKPPAPSAAQSTREAFKQLLETRSPAAPGLGAGTDVTASGSSAGSSLQSTFSSVLAGRDAFNPQTALSPSSLPSLTPATTLPNSVIPSYSSPAFNPPPAPSTPRTWTPPSSAFELPKRKF